MRYVRFRARLERLAADAGPIGAIHFEEVRRHVGTDAAHVFGGLLATLTAWAETAGIPYQCVPVHLAEGSLSKPVDKPSLPVWMLVSRALKLEYELTPDGLAECIRLAEEALALDPGSSRAHCALANGLFHMSS